MLERTAEHKEDYTASDLLFDYILTQLLITNLTSINQVINLLANEYN